MSPWRHHGYSHGKSEGLTLKAVHSTADWLIERIVSRHGGRVWADAEAGKGTTFRFTVGNNGSLNNAFLPLIPVEDS